MILSVRLIASVLTLAIPGRLSLAVKNDALARYPQGSEAC
jgi:hypothetical protein